MRNFLERFSAIDMTVGTPWKKLLLFTVPLLIGNIFQQLYSTIDAIFLGRFVGDNALAAILGSIAHELTHYFQWVNGLQLTNTGEERQAKRNKRFVLDKYAETREHP